MGIFDKLRNELIDIIEWVDDARTTLVWRFPRYQNEIKNGAQLIVRPGQVAVFVHEGKIADVFEPGRFELRTNNLPLLSTIMGWKYGFNSPFRSEVYFVSTRQITDLKWGTPNPIILRDADFGPCRVRAFGTYSLRAADPRILLKELVGTDGRFEAEEVNELLRSTIVTAFADLIGESKISVMDLAGSYKDFSDKLRAGVQERIDDEYGLEIPQLAIVNVSLPEEVEKAIDTRTSMGAIGDMNRFQQFQMGKAMTQPGGAGGAAVEGMGMGMGFAMAQKMANQGGAMASPVAPPPLVAAAWHIAVNGQPQGPYSIEQVAAAAAQGQVNAQTLVWSQGMANWAPAGQVPALAQAFRGTVPPPIG